MANTMETMSDYSDAEDPGRKESEKQLQNATSPTTFLSDVITLADTDYATLRGLLHDAEKSRSSSNAAFLAAVDKVFQLDSDASDAEHAASTLCRCDSARLLSHAEQILQLYCAAVGFVESAAEGGGGSSSSVGTFREEREADRRHLKSVIQAGARAVGREYGEVEVEEGMGGEDQEAEAIFGPFGEEGRGVSERDVLVGLQKAVKRMTEGVSIDA